QRLNAGDVAGAQAGARTRVARVHDGSRITAVRQSQGVARLVQGHRVQVVGARLIVAEHVGRVEKDVAGGGARRRVERLGERHSVATGHAAGGNGEGADANVAEP